MADDDALVVDLETVLGACTRRELEPATRPERRCPCHLLPPVESRDGFLRCCRSRRVLARWAVVDAVTGRRLDGAE